jgi:hypothetical protein
LSKVGDIITFDKYNWRVLDVDVQDKKKLIITEDIIEKRPYNVRYEDITWESCTLRQYLNGQFYNSFAEKNRIQPQTNENKSNQWFNTVGGKSTKDHVFLLSLEEVVRYFGDGSSAQLLANKGSQSYWIEDKNNNARRAHCQNNSSWWWLRSPGFHGYDAAGILGDGAVSVCGGIVTHAGGGVRPALWLNL